MFRFLITISLFLTTTGFAHDSVQGDGNNVNICKPTVVVKGCGCGGKKEVKVVQKVVEKTVEVEKRVYDKNRFSVLVGYGPKGNLKEYADKVVAENGVLLGVQYDRHISEKVFLSIQIQTNRTGMVGAGFGF